MSIELRNVQKRVGVQTHIHETNVKLERGEFNILLGTTLSGKTTLLRIMAGLERPTAGEIWYDGVDVTHVPVQKRKVSMVYQQFINYPNLTVFENIASPLRVVRAAEKEIRSKVGEVAELLDLTAMLKRMPHELSGGQQQRTALARSLTKDADLILLDEPLANLDYKLREELREKLPKLFRDTGATVVYATTEPSEALLLGGHTATLHEGRITQYGPTSVVYREPCDLISAQVFSDPPINIAKVEKKQDRFYLGEGISWSAKNRWQELRDGEYTLGCRPHHVGLAPVNQYSVQIRGEVQIAELSGSESTIHAKVLDKSWVALNHGIHRFEAGEIASLFLQTDRCLIFDEELRLMRT